MKLPVISGYMGNLRRKERIQMKEYLVTVVMHGSNEYDNPEGITFIRPKQKMKPVC